MSSTFSNMHLPYIFDYEDEFKKKIKKNDLEFRGMKGFKQNIKFVWYIKYNIIVILFKLSLAFWNRLSGIYKYFKLLLFEYLLKYLLKTHSIIPINFFNHFIII